MPSGMKSGGCIGPGRRPGRGSRRTARPGGPRRRGRRYGWLRKSMLEDIAGLTGGQVIPEDLGIELEKVTLDMPGKARRVTIP